MAQVDTRLALLPAQGVAGISDAVDNAFNTHYKSSANARQNALLDLQTQNQEANLSRQNALLDLQTQAAGREAEKHSFQMDAAKGAQLYRAMESLEKVPPESRVTQIEFMKEGLRKYGFDDDDWDILATDEGLAQGKAILSQYKPIASDAGTREFNSLTQGLDDQDVERARRIKLGLDPRASTSAEERIAGNSELTGAVAESQATIAEAEASAKERGKLSEQLELKPQVESAVTEAVESIKNTVDDTAAEKSNARSLAVYDEAMAGLVSALGNTKTGPGMGWISLTSEQQVADGAVAAMAPVLKQLFRGAGEGTFTDRDQEMLLNMVPTRKDHPEAIKAKIENIDGIVRAKLGEQPAARSTGGFTSSTGIQFTVE